MHYSYKIKMMKRKVITVVVSVALCAGGVVHVFGNPSAGTQIETPVEIHIPIFLKVLTFDRNLKNRAGDEIVLGILYQEKYRESLNIKNQVEAYLVKSGTNIVEGIPFRWVSINAQDVQGLKAALEKEKVDVLYIGPLRAISIPGIAAVSRSIKAISMTPVPAYCDSGISVGIDTRGESPLIIINLHAAQEEGVDFSSRLLKLAKIIDDK
jgi:hypothetical protein